MTKDKKKKSKEESKKKKKQRKKRELRMNGERLKKWGCQNWRQ